MSCLLKETYSLSLSAFLSVSAQRWPVAHGSQAVRRRCPCESNAKGLRLHRSWGQRAIQTLQAPAPAFHVPFTSHSKATRLLVKAASFFLPQSGQPSRSSSPWISCVCGVCFMALDHANMLYRSYWQEDRLPWSHLRNYAKISRKMPFRARYSGFKLF